MAKAPPHKINGFFNRLSLKWKMMVIILAITTVGLLLVSLGLALNQRVTFQQAGIDNLSILADVIGSNSRAALTFKDADAGKETLAALRANPHIIAAAIFDETGEVFAQYFRNNTPIPLPQQVPGEDVQIFEGEDLFLYRPILFHDQKIGMVFLQSDTLGITAHLQNFAVVASLLFLGVTVVIILLSNRFQGWITVPIYRLVRTTRAVSRHKNYALRAVKDSDDELGVLVDGFNNMLAEIQKADEKLRASEALHKRAEEKFKRVIESVSNAIVMIDKTGQIVLVNSQAEKYFGYSREELTGKPVTTLIPPRFREGHLARMPNFFSNPQIRQFTQEVNLFGLRKDGSEFPIEIGISPIEAGEGIQALSTISDITDRMKAEQERERYARELERSNQELQQFASVASHDLQEPLRKILAFGDRLAYKYKDKLEEQGSDYLERMQNAASRMKTLINDLLTFSRVTSAAKPFETVALDKIVAGVLSDLEIRIEQSNGKVEVGELPEIEADEFQMRQLFQNLISNALKFQRPDVPPLVKIYVESSLQQNGAIKSHWKTPDMTYICIQDNGIGFDEKYLDRIFTVFQRLHGRSEYEGTGIGLAVCRRIAERHGGTITASSKPGAGATFKIILPAKHAKEATREK